MLKKSPNNWADSQKNILKPHLKQQWVIPPEANAAFVAAMEDVLEVYHRALDPQRPLICLDEASVQLLEEVREPLALRPGSALTVDSEYKRQGVQSYFMLVAPLLGWRQVTVTGTRTKSD